VAENPGGGTGGYSVLQPRPSYQRNVSSFNDRKYLIPTDFQQIAPGLTEPTGFAFNPTPTLQSGVNPRGRATPDVSTNGDPQTGYAVYDPMLFADTGGFAQFGGTSFVAPQLNGATAVIDSAVGGRRVGFWSPQIDGFADSRHSPFTPLNDTTTYAGPRFLWQTSAPGVKTAVPGEFSNNNLFYAGKRGATWNPASGLGIPNLAALAETRRSYGLTNPVTGRQRRRATRARSPRLSQQTPRGSGAVSPRSPGPPQRSRGPPPAGPPGTRRPAGPRPRGAPG
jgi:subtilase family serine protease